MSTAQTGLEQTTARPTTVSDIIGLKVYTLNGVYVGTVDDIRINFATQQSTGVALRDVNVEIEKVADDSRQGVVIPYKWVEAVNDVVLTTDIMSRLEPRS